MEHDIFISYAHHDDEIHERWVRQFAKQLEDDYRSRTGRKLNIFLDKEDLRTGQLLDERLQQALRQTRVFVPILSPTYLASEWCRREFESFLTIAGDALVLRDGSSRILPVRLMPYTDFAGDEAAVILDFLAEKELLYTDFYRDELPIEPKAADFKKMIAGLSATVRELLVKLSMEPLLPDQETAPPPPPPAHAPAIFIAHTSSFSQELRSRLLTELQQQRKYGKIDFRLLPDEADDAPTDPAQLSAAQLEALTRRYISESVFSIHLFDDLPGRRPEDAAEPIPQLQYRIAKAAIAGQADLKLFSLSVSKGEGSAEQQMFLEQVADDVLEREQIDELPGAELKTIKDYLLEQIGQRAVRPVQEAEQVQQGSVSRVFLVHDYRDKNDPLRADIENLMFNQRWEVVVPVFREDDPDVDPDEHFGSAWLLSSRAVVLLRNASTAWCNAIKVELIKLGAEKKSPSRMAICVADPDAAARLREVRSDEFELINCALPDYRRQLLDFLNT
jgi:TIR domain